MNTKVTEDQVDELKDEFYRRNINGTQIIGLHNKSNLSPNYSRIYKYDEETINKMYPTGWALARHIQDYAESGIYEFDYFCFNSEKRPCYVSNQVSNLVEESNSPIDFKAIYELLTNNPNMAVKLGIKLSGMDNPDLSDEGKQLGKQQLVSFIQHSILPELTTTELQSFVRANLDKANEEQRQSLLKMLLN